jgi:hypothetical protein
LREARARSEGADGEISFVYTNEIETRIGEKRFGQSAFGVRRDDSRAVAARDAPRERPGASDRVTGTGGSLVAVRGWTCPRLVRGTGRRGMPH